MVEQHDVDDDLDMPGAGTDRPTGAADAPVADGVPDGKDTGSDAAQKLAEQHDRYLRLAAEYDNFRKRSNKERAEAQSRGQADQLKSMLDVLDDIGRFAHVDPATTNAETVVEGVAMVEKKLQKTLGSLGLEVVNPVDEPFDPALHEAVMTEPAASPEDDHMVARVFQLGYLFNGQLLRPARVVVKQWNG
jgi:molecular chaperone GrpE